MPACPCLQLADFTLCDSTGQPVATEWLCRMLGSPGVVEPAVPQEPFDEEARAAEAQAANGLAVRCEVGVRRLGGQELKVRPHRPPRACQPSRLAAASRSRELSRLFRVRSS